MNSFKLSVEKIYTGTRVLKNQTVEVEDGVIKSIRDCRADEPANAGLLIPGFIDVQVNGGGGVLFNHKPNTDSLRIIAKAHHQYGTTCWLPTLVTDSTEKMKLAADAVAEYRAANHPEVLGIHFEGPFISVEKKGVHSPSLIRTLSDRDMAVLTRKDIGQVVLTVAPEIVSPSCIRELTQSGVIVSLGHSNASYQQTIAAMEAGATGFTHLFNAMSQLGSREPGLVGAALSAKDTYSGIILDRIHVHPITAKLAYNSATELMLVTDAMPPVGTMDSQFEFFGQTVYRESDRLTDFEGRLAGAVLDMNTAVKNAIEIFDIDVFSAIDLATKVPANFLKIGAECGQLKPGFRANMLILNNSQEVCSSWVGGKLVYQSLS